MASDEQIPQLGRQLAATVRGVMAEIRPRLVHAAITGKRSEKENLRHSDNFLSEFDLWMHERYLGSLSDSFPSYVYASEEAAPRVVGSDPDPDLCILVDPLDTSELAVRALNGYTHVMAYSRSLKRPVAAVVGDIFHHVQLYLAAYDGRSQDLAFAVTADQSVYPLRTRPGKPLAEALVTNFLMKPAERFAKLAQQQRLLQALSEPTANGKSAGRLGVDFGSVGLCHIAAGFTDAMVEFAKGFAIWDLAPGHYVLSAAGGAVTDMQGNPLPLEYKFDTLDDIAAAMNGRQTFVAAADLPLAQHIAGLVDP
jgi:myo-inositol-1(or 4)-monophosphatase